MADIDGMAKVYIDRERLVAYLEVVPPSGEGDPCTFEQAMKLIQDYKISYGLDEKVVREAVREENWEKQFVIARGKAAEDGKDAQLKFLVPVQDVRMTPEIDEKGQADYYNLGLINNVSRGQALAERIPPVDGIKGMDVTGKEIAPRSGRDIPLPRGKNTVANEENTLLFAVIDGHAKLQNGKISVEPIFELNGDVDFSSGNIDFVGNVIIHGSVTSGFSVQAGGDIEIMGFIEAAEVVAAGNIMVRGGIQAVTKNTIKAGGSIMARFVENSRLEAGQDIRVREAIMQSNIRAGNSVIVSDRRATIVGGVIQASQLVEAKILGSQLATQTIIEVGVNPYHREEYRSLMKTRTEQKKRLDTLNTNLQSLQRAGISPQEMSTRKRMALIKMLDEYKRVKQEYKEGEERILVLEEEFNKAKAARIRASEVAYPGVRISIGSAFYLINDPIKYSQFVLEEGEVRLASL